MLRAPLLPGSFRTCARGVAKIVNEVCQVIRTHNGFHLQFNPSPCPSRLSTYTRSGSVGDRKGTLIARYGSLGLAGAPGLAEAPLSWLVSSRVLLRARAIPISPGHSAMGLKQVRRALRFAGVLKRVSLSGMSRKTRVRQVTVDACMPCQGW